MLDDDDRYSWMIERNGEIVGNIEINDIRKLSPQIRRHSGGILYTDWAIRKTGVKALGVLTKQAACNWAFSDGGLQ